MKTGDAATHREFESHTLRQRKAVILMQRNDGYFIFAIAFSTVSGSGVDIYQSICYHIFIADKEDTALDKIAFSDLIGKTILIGLTYYTANNEFIEQKQYWGSVVESNEKRILVKLNNGEIFKLPPDLSSTQIAPPGEYRLRSTGETVVDPDYLTTWNINRPAED